MSARDKAEATHDVGENLQDHPAMAVAARAGFVVIGAVYFLIAGIALVIAWGDTPDDADNAGALALVARQPLGEFVLWIGAAACLALGLWQIIEGLQLAWRAATPKQYLPAVKALARGVAYGAVGVTSVQVASRFGGSGGSDKEELTAAIMSKPGGIVLVALIGAGILGYGLYCFFKSLTLRFLEDLEPKPGAVVKTLGVVGYLGKGVAFTTVGIFFIRAALEHDPDKSGGLDEALRTIAQQPWGAYLLTVVALGLATFGIYNITRSRLDPRI